ncbi:WUSCHEL-related homeobox 9-like [Vicia villosa]|uniref:WUSCHEL-related homeobox 9-like n=1 Tax=Vicia villosa TaxID=3911 RepID=UPI00273BAA73|nr:WUSCHEL-related homeobox 9-like [Vicia villosa]
MSSSNKHWPSMFKKSKPDNHQNWQHGMNSSLLSAGLQTTPVTLGADVDDRSPEPKPRWNPKPEQIRILESIFNSGMVNPPREEIKKIRTQLQEFGQVGDANVFYWFQNRKSRSKNKHRHLHSNPRNKKNSAAAAQIITAPPNSSPSSSSDHPNVNASTNEAIIVNVNNIGFSNVNDGIGVLPNSPNVNQNQTAYNFLQTTPAETNFQLPTPPSQPFFSFSMENNNNNNINEGLAQVLYLSDQYSNSNMVNQPLPQQNVALPLFNPEIMMNYGIGNSPMNNQHDQENNIQEEAMNLMHMNQQDPQQLGFGVPSRTHDSSLVPLPPVAMNPSLAPFHIPQFQGVDKPKCKVIINSTVVEVEVGPFNVGANFGDGAVLFDSSGQRVPTDEWGVTLDSLQHGASYYMV